MNDKVKQTKQDKDERHKASINGLKAAIWKLLNVIPECYNQWSATKTGEFIEFQHNARQIMNREKLGFIVLTSLLAQASEWHNPINQQIED